MRSGVEHSETLIPDVEPTIVVRSMVALWGFYFLIATLRSIVEDRAGAASMLAPRFAVSLASIGLTALLYLLLRPIVLRSLSRSIAIAVMMCLPAALAYGATNWLMFEQVFPGLERLMGDRHEVDYRRGGAAQSGIVVGSATTESYASALTDIVSTSLNGYFFFVCWCALYAALSYAARTRELERRSARLQAAAQSSELRALRYQINPHFLFNTLNSLSSLVMADRKSEAEHMLVQLSTFFRATLNGDPTADLPLKEEIGLQRLYLEMEGRRFGGRMQVEIDVPPELESACVPGLILQPLVENSIKHSVSRSVETVTISIKAAAVGGQLILSMTDSCPVALPRSDGRRSGVGLANVRDRMTARFGEAGAISWKRTRSGFAVTLSMPLIYDAS